MNAAELMVQVLAQLKVAKRVAILGDKLALKWAAMRAVRQVTAKAALMAL